MGTETICGRGLNMRQSSHSHGLASAKRSLERHTKRLGYESSNKEGLRLPAALGCPGGAEGDRIVRQDALFAHSRRRSLPVTDKVTAESAGLVQDVG